MWRGEQVGTDESEQFGCQEGVARTAGGLELKFQVARDAEVHQEQVACRE